MVIKFANETKLGDAVNMLKDREVTRRHLERRKHGSEQEMIGK